MNASKSKTDYIVGEIEAARQGGDPAVLFESIEDIVRQSVDAAVKNALGGLEGFVQSVVSKCMVEALGGLSASLVAALQQSQPQPQMQMPVQMQVPMQPGYVQQPMYAPQYQQPYGTGVVSQQPMPVAAPEPAPEPVVEDDTSGYKLNSSARVKNENKANAALALKGANAFK